MERKIIVSRASATLRGSCVIVKALCLDAFDSMEFDIFQISIYSTKCHSPKPIPQTKKLNLDKYSYNSIYYFRYNVYISYLNFEDIHDNKFVFSSS